MSERKKLTFLKLNEICKRGGKRGCTNKYMKLHHQSSKLLENDLYKHISETIEEIDEFSFEKIEKFVIGKTHLKKTHASSLDSESIEGLHGRWRDTYQTKDYNALVALLIVTEDKIPADEKTKNAEEYALKLEKSMISKFEDDKRCNNYNDGGGGRTCNSTPFAGVVYLAFKLTNSGEMSPQEEMIKVNRHGEKLLSKSTDIQEEQRVIQKQFTKILRSSNTCNFLPIDTQKLLMSHMEEQNEKWLMINQMQKEQLDKDKEFYDALAQITVSVEQTPGTRAAEHTPSTIPLKLPVEQTVGPRAAENTPSNQSASVAENIFSREPNFDSMLMFLSKNIGKEWQQVLINLGIPPARLKQYDMDEKYTEHKILRGLREWYGGRETTADRQKDIIDALSNSGLRSIAEEVLNKFRLQQDPESQTDEITMSALGNVRDMTSQQNIRDMTSQGNVRAMTSQQNVRGMTSQQTAIRQDILNLREDVQQGEQRIATVEEALHTVQKDAAQQETTRQEAQDARGALAPCYSSRVTQPEDEAPYSKEIGYNRFVKVQTWEGEVRIDIRQWENGFNEMEPTTKGISLTLQQWGKFVQNMGKVDGALRQRRREKIHLGKMKFVEVTGENRCVDLRVYWKPEGFLEPTKKGIRLQCDEYMELKGVKSLISDSAENLNRP